MKSITMKLGITLVAGLFAVACSNEAPPVDDNNDDPTIDPSDDDTSSSDEDNTFEHEAGADPFDLLDRLREEGPPRYTSRVHSCSKMRYQTTGNVLATLGVNMAANGQDQAGRMYRDADQALGAARYTARIREKLELTTASAAKMFDIFIQAAPEIIAALPTLPHCQVNGVGVEMFDGSGNINPDAISCIIGTSATVGHVDIANFIVDNASSTAIGQEIAVAALLAAAHTCE